MRGAECPGAGQVGRGQVLAGEHLPGGGGRRAAGGLGGAAWSADASSLAWNPEAEASYEVQAKEGKHKEFWAG